MKAYWLIFRAEILRTATYRLNYFANYVLHFISLLLYLVVWRFIFNENGTLHGYNWHAMVVYYTLAGCLLGILFPTHLYELQPLIRKGTLNSLLIKPMQIETTILAKFMALKLPMIVCLSTLSWLFLKLFNIHADLDISVATCVLLLLSFALTFFMGLFGSVLAFWLIEMWPIRRLFQAGMALLGGMLAPLDLLPHGLATCAAYTPFPYLGYFNIKALLGQCTQPELIHHSLIAAGWVIFFLMGFKILWRLGLRKYEAVNL